MRTRILPILLALAPALLRAEGFAVDPPAAPFQDVEVEHWAYDAVDQLRDRGLLEGWGERFHGRRTFSRYEMAEILARYTEKLDEARAGLGEGAARRAPGGTASGERETRRTLEQKVDELRRRRDRRQPGPLTRLVESGGVEALEDKVERIAAMVATHQVLLERPEAQEEWRQELGVEPPTGRHGPGLHPPYRPASPEAPPDPRTHRLLQDLDVLSRGVEDRAQAVTGPGWSRTAPGSTSHSHGPEAPAGQEPTSRQRLRMALARVGGSQELVRDEARQERRALFRRRMDLSRELRGSGAEAALPPLPRVPPAAPTGLLAARPGAPASAPASLERAQDLRLLEALEAVRRGELPPERARVVAELATLALQAPVGN